MTKQRLHAALAVYAALAVAAIPVAHSGLRLALWIFLAGLALKTYVAWLQQRGDQ